MTKSSIERRKEPRMLCADLVTIAWYDSAGEPRREVVNLEDISNHGICLQTESPLTAGTVVEVVAGKSVMKGEVRYCRRHELGNFVGIQMSEGSCWPKRSFQPKHLLDPRLLLARKVLRHLQP